MPRKSTLVFILSSLLALPSFGHGVTAFENGRRLVDGELIEGIFYAVDGQLQTIAPEGVARSVDLGGGIVVPALADAHNHALADGRFEEEANRFLAQGIFWVQNPNSVRTPSLKARELAAAAETPDVRYSMAGLTSSGGHPAQIYDAAAAHMPGWSPDRMDGEAYVAIDSEADLERRWSEILGGGPDLLKTYLERSEAHESRRGDDAFYGKRGLDPKLLPKIVARARAESLRVTTHVTSAEDVRVAIAAGVDELAHLPLERLTADDARAIAAAGVVVVTTTLSHRPTPGVEDLDALHAHNLKILFEHGVWLVLGTDSHKSVLDEALNLVRLGVDRAVVLELLTEKTAQWVFPERAIGRLTPGAEASFLVLSADPRQHLEAFRRPALRVKEGHVLSVEELPESSQQSPQPHSH